MKKWYVHLAVVLATALALVSMVGCEEGGGVLNDDSTIYSQIEGVYAPLMENGVGVCTLKATWIDAVDVPVIDMTEFGMGAVSYDMLLEMLNAPMGRAYADALVRFEFCKDGSILVSDRDDDGEVSTFPDGTAEDAHIASMISYSTPLNATQGKLLFTFKRALFRTDNEAGFDLNAILDGLVVEYPNLGIELSKEAISLPLKYKLDGNVLTIWVDREMMLPFLPVMAKYLLPMLPEQVDINGTMFTLRSVVASALNGLFNKSSELRLQVKMVRV